MEIFLIHYILFVISLLLNFIVGVLCYNHIYEINWQKVAVIIWCSMFVPPISIIYGILSIINFIFDSI